MIDELYRHKFIVWGFEHYNPLGIVRSLGEEGIRPYVLIIKSKTESITSASKYVKEKYFAATMDEAYAILIQKFGNENEYKPFIITSDDTVTSYLDMKYEELKNKFIFFNAGCPKRVSYFMNKNNINDLAKKHGLDILPTYVVKRGEIPNKIKYPVITKAISSITPGWKADVFVCQNRKELINAYREIKSEVVLLQKYIHKKNELCIDGFSVDKGKSVSFTIASNYNSVNESTYSNNMTIFTFKKEDLANSLRAMMKEIGFEGIWSAEFLVDQNDDFHFLEINFRNSTWSYAATCLKMNMVVGWAESMLKGYISPDFEKPIPSNYMAIAELQDYRDRVKQHKISVIKWIKELNKYQCKFLYNKQDMKPFWNEIRAIICRKIHRV